MDIKYKYHIIIIMFGLKHLSFAPSLQNTLELESILRGIVNKVIQILGYKVIKSVKKWLRN